jgi:hypothetical protein
LDDHPHEGRRLANMLRLDWCIHRECLHDWLKYLTKQFSIPRKIHRVAEFEERGLEDCARKFEILVNLQVCVEHHTTHAEAIQEGWEAFLELIEHSSDLKVKVWNEGPEAAGT